MALQLMWKGRDRTQSFVLMFTLHISKFFFNNQIHNTELSMAFRCGHNIHIIKYEIENTNIIPKGVNESNCINTKSKMLKSIKITTIRGRDIEIRSRQQGL